VAKRILLADADAFYVAVARLVDPEGAGRAPLLIVGGSAEHRGVVTSASYEARRFGVHSAMPTAQALRLCPGAMVAPVPMRACVEKGREIRRALLQFTPVVQQASSDEFYLDMSGTEKLYHGEPLTETAKRMRQAVLEATHLAVSIGGGTSRVVAKLAAGVAKPPSPLSPLPAGVGNQAAGVFVVPEGEEVEFMRRFSLADIHGVGPRFQDRLARLGLITVNDALAKDEHTLAAWLGSRAGKWLFDRIRGVDDGFVAEHQRAKSISRDETFAEDIDDDAALNERLLELVDRATSDLRGNGWLARTVTVRLRDNDFTDRQASRTVRPPISSDRAVLAVARGLLRRLRMARRIPARLLGVAVSTFVEAQAPSQLSLFQAEAGVEETARDRAVAQAIDHLRRRFGHDAIVRGRTTD
jgi:DNA polymerase IV